MDTHSPASDNIDLLRHVADVNGVATGFWDWYGNWIGVGAPTLLKVLGALGLPLDESSTVGDVENAMRLTDEREWRRTLPPTIVARQGGGYEFRVHVPMARGSMCSGFSRTDAKGSVSNSIAMCRRA